MTGSTAIFWPMIAEVVLIYAIYFVVSARRVGAVKRGEVPMRAFEVPVSEPAPSATAIRSLSNQFELPVLFFVACLALYITNAASYPAVLVAWAFVASRAAHAFVHVTSNDLRLRRPLFIVGFVLNAVLWGLLAFNLAVR